MTLELTTTEHCKDKDNEGKDQCWKEIPGVRLTCLMDSARIESFSTERALKGILVCTCTVPFGFCISNNEGLFCV